MTLTTHALIGAAAAQLFPAHPYLAFAAGFASHFAADALPHWDYHPASIEKDPYDPLKTDMHFGRQFARDLAYIGGDAVLGMALSVILFSAWLFHAPPAIVLIGAAAGIFPDALQFAYFKTRSRFLEPLQRFHIWVQQGKSLFVEAHIGIGLQAALVFVLLVAEKIIL